MKTKSNYPWFFFLRTVQLSVFIFMPVLIALMIIDRSVFMRIFPLALLCQIVFIILFYKATKPLGTILSKVQKFRGETPLDNTIRLLYEKDEWSKLETALNEADTKLREQVNQAKFENEKIGAILESISDAIIAIDPFETILFSNTNFKKNFNPEEIQKGIIPKLWHVFEQEEVLNTYRQVLKDGSPQNYKTVSFNHRYFELTVTPLRGAEGKTIGALGVFHDVTDFKLTEQMRVDFVANVSHEIRTPLTSIKGFSQVLIANKSKFPEEYQNFLTKIVSNTERMIALFNDLLNLSVIESQEIAEEEELDLPRVFSTIIPNIRANYPDKKIHFEDDFKASTVHGDSRLLELVLTNLIDNACKYSESELSLKISSQQTKTHTVIRIQDNGPGISPEHLPRIFERFYRVDSSREAKRGTGLGLAIVKHIIMKHGGRIRAESAGFGTGTTFVIELPLE